MVKILKFGQNSERMVKILTIYGFVWFDLGFRALNFNNASSMVYYEDGHRAARVAKKKTVLKKS